MAEFIRDVKVTLIVDTNKHTYQLDASSLDGFFSELASFEAGDRLLLPQVESLRRLLRQVFEAGVDVPQDALSRGSDDEADEIANGNIDDAIKAWAREESE